MLTLLGLWLLVTTVWSDPHVSTPYGGLKGFTHTTEGGVDVNVFLGIRYAQAPDHIFRFEKPEPVEKWHPIIHHATRFRAACIPFHRDALTRENYSEDCLFLNIVTPKNNEPKKKYPVLVFIHGGGFEIGDSETYGYKVAAENFVSRDVMFVSIQYRLGALGFFTLGDNVAPGNLGLWDQTMALQFLHEVLPSFGGDVDQITTMGHSAGSASVSALQFSPHSDHLFNQAIELSGSVFSEFAMSEFVVKESKALADFVGCKDSDSLKIMECMKERTMDELLDAVDELGSSRRHTNFLKFQPHFDKDFFPFEVDDMARKAPKKKTIVGLTDKESGLFALIPGVEYLGDVLIPESHWGNFSREDLMEFIINGVVTEHEYGRKTSPFLQLVTEFYVDENDAELERDSKYYINKYVDILSDLQFLIPAVHEIELKRMNGWETYSFVIDYQSDSMKLDVPVKGAFHATELRFLLEFLDQEKIPQTENDKKFKTALLEAFINFIKTGNPSTLSLPWNAVSIEKPLVHMRFNEKSEMKEKFRPEAVDFWLQTVPKKIGTNILKTNRLPAAKAHISHSEL